MNHSELMNSMPFSPRGQPSTPKRRRTSATATPYPNSTGSASANGKVAPSPSAMLAGIGRRNLLFPGIFVLQRYPRTGKVLMTSVIPVALHSGSCTGMCHLVVDVGLSSVRPSVTV